MPRERQRAEAADGDQVVRLQRERLVQGSVGLRVPARIAGLPRALLVGKPERGPVLGVAGVPPELGLECAHETRGVAGAEAGREPCGGGQRRGGRFAAAPQEAAEGEDGGRDRRRRPCDEEP